MLAKQMSNRKIALLLAVVLAAVLGALALRGITGGEPSGRSEGATQSAGGRDAAPGRPGRNAPRVGADATTDAAAAAASADSSATDRTTVAASKDTDTTTTLADAAGALAGLPGATGGGTAFGATSGGTTAEPTPSQYDLEREEARRKNSEKLSGDLEPGMGLIGGQVRRGESGVASAELVLTNKATSVDVYTATGTEGFYTFAAQLPGEYVVRLVRPAAPNSTRYLTLAADERRLSEDFNIPSTEPVRGRTVSSSDGSVAAKPTITVYAGSAFIGYVYGLDDGTFELMPLDPGAYRATFLATGFTQGEESFTVVEEGEQPFLLVELDPAQPITGTVLMPDGSPAGSALVSLFRQGSNFGDPYSSAGVLRADGAGNFTFPSLPAGASEPFRAGAHSPGTIAAYSAAFIDPADSSALAQPLLVRLGDGPPVTGRVADKDGKVVEGATVTVVDGFSTVRPIYQRLNQSLGTASTGDDGRFEIRPVEPGAAKVSVVAVGFLTKEVETTVGAQGVDLGTITLESDSDPEEGRIFGIVVNEVGGPIHSADTYVRCLDCEEPAERYRRTDSAGYFIFDELPEGSYSISVNGATVREGIYIPMSQVLAPVATGETQTVVLFDQGQSAVADVTGADGQPAGRVRVSVVIDESRPSGTTADNEWRMRYDHEFNTSGGRLTVPHLMSGNANFVFSVPGGGTTSVNNVRISPGQVVDLGDILVGEAGTVTGTIVSEGVGQPVAGAFVALLAPRGAPPEHPLRVATYSTSALADGSFVIGGVPLVEEAIVLVTAANHVATYVEGVAIQRATDLGAVEILRAGRIAGTVRDERGAALVDIYIRADGWVAYTDGQGVFETTSAPPGRVQMEVIDRSGAHLTVFQEVEVVAGQSTTVEVILPDA
ncbi:MAG: carboxypeptidase regulatory-like domain-containing protein [Candidatus Sumerlaeia bacterium]|nr:carboxypeptidase regulatory-like domain-containing protein [Candidatus Sumerlaeia bacterium]